jgi:hypothetical protein
MDTQIAHTNMKAAMSIRTEEFTARHLKFSGSID